MLADDQDSYIEPKVKTLA